MQDLTGKVALVTGGGRGIGRAVSIALAAAGCDVAVNYREHREPADATVREIREMDRKAAAIRADVSHSSEVARLVEQSYSDLGGIDILVNNAGIAQPCDIDALTEDDWDHLITVNLKSCFLATQAVLPVMRRKHWGRVINISSVAAHVGGVVGAHYAASKAGMLGLTHYYAQRLTKEGVTVNAISPALIDTDMVRANLNAKPDRIPVGRFGQSDEVADVAVMLARNGYITGQTVHVNGGWFMT